MAEWLLRGFGVVLLLSALALPLAWAPDLPVQGLVARWAPPPSDFIDLRGQLVHFRDEGPRNDPLPLVLIHGVSGSLHTWEGWVRALKPRHRVITFDLPGFGLTGPFSGDFAPGDYSGDTYARFVLQLLDALKVRRAVIGGNAFGGEVAWRTAGLAPARVAALILVDSTGPAFVPRVMPLAFRMAQLPVIHRIGEWILPRGVIEQELRDAYADPARITPERVDRGYDMALREGNRQALTLVLQQRHPGADIARLGQLKMQTLILWGAQDRLIPPAAAQVFARSIPGSQVIVLDHLGHLPQEEDPARSVEPVKAFLLGLDRPETKP